MFCCGLSLGADGLRPAHGCYFINEIKYRKTQRPIQNHVKEKGNEREQENIGH